MIKVLKKERKEVHSVLDIETGKKGNLLAMSIFNNKLEKPIHFYSWSELLDFLQENNEDNYYRKIFAHNGGGFDWVHLFSWYFEDSKEENDKVEIILAGSSIIFGQILFFENPVVFCDTLLTLKSSLAQLCEVFKPAQPKLKDFPIQYIELIFIHETEYFFKYLDNDVMSLNDIMNQFMSLVEIEFFPLTVASLGLYLYKLKFLDENILLHKPTQHEDEFISKSYAGGRVECFSQGEYKKVYTYDLNSLYPYIMSKCEIPICKPSKTQTFLKGEVGFYSIYFKQNDVSLPPIFWKKTDKFGLVFCYEGTGVFCSHEINLALSLGVEIEFYDGYYFPETEIIFNGYVEHFYNLRLTFDKSHPMNLIAKYLMNALYGKFSEKEKKSKLVCLNNIEAENKIDNGEPIKVYDPELNLYEIETEKKVPHRLIYIASIITSLARCELYKYLQEYKNHVLYCDTDCVHLDIKMDKKYLGNELGMMKAENSGRGIYIGRKMYGIFDGQDDKIRYKGLSTKSKLPHDEMTEENMRTILNQEREKEKTRNNCHMFNFNTFPKLKSVLKHQGKAGVMKPITKALKKPDYTSNFRKDKKEWI